MRINPLLDEFQFHASLPGSILLEASHSHETYGQFSLMALRPFLVLQSKNGLVSLTSHQGTQTFPGDSLQILEELLRNYQDESSHFFGPGAIGYITYEHGYSIHQLPAKPHDDLFLPDLWFAFYNEIVCYDHLQSKLISFKSVKEKKEPIKFSPQPMKKNYASPLVSTFREYEEAFLTIMENIKAGNIYQANLCQRFSAPVHENPWSLYLRLRTEHPTPLMAYLNTGKNVILSASPELFLRKEKNQIKTAPIKGTIRKFNELQKDLASQQRLARGQKERAEHIMIVDLERNDLGRICVTGSIRPEKLFQMESCGSVYHLVSTISGTIRKDAEIRKIIQATFPGGSVTGAPKRKAIEILAAVEPKVRGIYTGALGWIGFSGNFIFNLPIRTFLIQDSLAHFYAGGGIVADSTAEAEYEELLDKGRFFFNAMGIKPHVAVPVRN